MKNVLWLAILCFTLQASAQDVAVKEKNAKHATIDKMASKKNTLTEKKPLVVEKDTLINGETVTMLEHEQQYAAASRFEKMLAKRLEIDAAEARRREKYQ